MFERRCRPRIIAPHVAYFVDSHVAFAAFIASRGGRWRFSRLAVAAGAVMLLSLLGPNTAAAQATAGAAAPQTISAGEIHSVVLTEGTMTNLRQNPNAKKLAIE